MKTRLARFGAAAVLSLTLLTACGGGSEGTNVDCGLDQCTVAFDRGVDAQASVLGIEAKVVKVEGDQVTLEIAGEQLTLTAGQPAADVEGLKVTVVSVTESEVKVKISR